MTIIEAITSADNLKHNAFALDIKISWLSKLDWMIKKHIIDTHEGASGVTYAGYTPETPLETELLAPAPYDEMYRWWLEAQMDLVNREIDNYNVSIIRFTEEYESFASYYNRTHMPIGSGKRFLF